VITEYSLENAIFINNKILYLFTICISCYFLKVVLVALPNLYLI